MGYNSITIPNGFVSKKSYINWRGFVEVDNGFGAPGATFHRQMPPIGGKVHEIVQPHSKGGVVRLKIEMQYKLVKLVDAPMNQQIPKEVESGAFWFGCEWPYSYSQSQLAFGPAQKYTSPAGRGFKLLQGSCEEVQSKDQAGTAVLPYVCAAPQLALKSAPGEAPSGWSFQLPVVGGPSYTEPGGEATPDGGFRLGTFWIELAVRVPEPKVEIDLQPLQLMLVFENEAQADISAARFRELDAWINSVRKSNLFPVIQNRYLTIHIWGHASKPGTPLKNQDLSIQRRKNVQSRLEAMVGASVEIVPMTGEARTRRLWMSSRTSVTKSTWWTEM